MDGVEDRMRELGDLDLVVLWAFVERPGVDPAALAVALKGTGFRLRRWRVRRAIRRLLERDLLRVADGGAEASVRYVPGPGAARLLPIAIATREIEGFEPEHLAVDRDWAAGRRRGRWPDP
jgi:hypothetical protein